MEADIFFFYGMQGVVAIFMIEIFTKYFEFFGVDHIQGWNFPSLSCLSIVKLILLEDN